ncbi:HTH-type transcriptional repressor nemR [Raoultella terrigena]|uniref:HTH-type transcriptional repressor nemR n=1 Tax=Raoultella terrigena TaxID=577 RepID=A0A4U9CXI6_RAOTE|nr:HTH-type transcriptional repressor nemR [Raoultella terrigena]
MDKGASQIITLLGEALEKGRQEGSLVFSGDALTLSQVLYSLWLAPTCRPRLRAAQRRLKSALAHAKILLPRLAFKRRFYLTNFKTTGLLRSHYVRIKIVYPVESGCGHRT